LTRVGFKVSTALFTAVLLESGYPASITAECPAYRAGIGARNRGLVGQAVAGV
jgi:hypothetical protein